MITKQHIDEVINQLAAVFPAWQAAIKTQEQANNLKRVWFDEVNRQGLTEIDLRRGLLQARQSESPYLPSLGQFVGWCKNQSHLTPERAWQMAAMSQTQPITDPLVAEAVKRTGRYDIINRSERDIKPLFLDHYREVIDEAKQGVVFRLPEPKADQIKIEEKPTDPEEARKHVAKILKMLEEK